MKDSVPALSRLVSIEHVAATFVFNSKADILAREVPDHYSDENLQQVAKQILDLDAAIRSIGTNTQELQLRFDNYALWVRCFQSISNCFLVLFLEKDADFLILQQPINLAVLNLEKVIQRSEDAIHREASQSDLAKIAKEAEKSLLSSASRDSNGLFAKLTLVANYLLGPIGDELLLSGCRELDIQLPLDNTEQIQKLIEYCSKEITAPERKSAFINQTEDVIQRLLLSAK